jgi:polynucleotide 5'-kinase involved in rRNA processing
MRSLFRIIPRMPRVAALLIFVLVPVARAQDPKLQLSQLDRLAAKASQTVEVNLDERLMQIAAKIFNPKDEDEARIKKLVNGLKGIYVKSFEFDNEGEFTSADVDSIRSQLRAPAWSKMLNVTSKKEGNIEVYLLLNGSQVGGLAVISTDVKELTVVNIVGPVDLEKLAQLEGQLGIPDLGIEPTKSKTKNDK